METWKYYNHAMIPAMAPNQTPDISELKKKAFWKTHKRALLARWTTDFDCGYETNWWYVIKDTPFDLLSLKAKRRYEVNKGIKNYDVQVIDPRDYREALYFVQVAAFSAYPEKYRPKIQKEMFMSKIDGWQKFVVFGAFSRQTEELCGYALLAREDDRCVGLNVLKTKPEHEKYGVNAALVEGILQHYAAFLSDGGYICDGARSIQHETAFQDYLEKYFGFRKAYCSLHIVYNPKIKWMITLLYPMRKIFLGLDNIGLVHQLNAVLRMEELCRNKV